MMCLKPLQALPEIPEIEFNFGTTVDGKEGATNPLCVRHHLKSMQQLGMATRVVPEVQRYACVSDKMNFTAADLAAEAGHTDLSAALRHLMRSSLDAGLRKAEQEYM
jgi:hypothetical protein